VVVVVQSGRSFSVTLRGFGSELPLAAKEMQSFCDGTHPCQKAPSGGHKLQCESATHGSFYRDHKGVSLSSGLLECVRCHGDGELGTIPVMQAMQAAAMVSRSSRLSALQDCEIWWNKQKSPQSGKFFPLRQSDPEVHAVFFDAQAGSQVDPRDDQGNHVPLHEVSGEHVIAVDPLLAMSDEGYLITMLEKAEDRRQCMPARAPSTTFGLTEVMSF